MTTAHLCILAAIWLPYLATFIAKFSARGFGPEQNRAPRDWLAALTGYRKRAHFAQQNGFEVTPAFAAAVLVAQQIGTAPQPTVDALAIAFVVGRVLYTACYVADWARLRSVIWATNMGIVTALFWLSA